MKIVHLCIMAIIILGFGYLPPFSSVTPFGMKAIGCFLGIIYGWVFINMLWTALAVFILVPFTGLITADGLISTGSVSYTHLGERLGLGTDLFSDRETLAEQLGLDELNEELSKHSNYYNYHFLYTN